MAEKIVPDYANYDSMLNFLEMFLLDYATKTQSSDLLSLLKTAVTQSESGSGIKSEKFKSELRSFLNRIEGQIQSN